MRAAARGVRAGRGRHGRNSFAHQPEQADRGKRREDDENIERHGHGAIVPPAGLKA
jgi:hypothetical protein